MAFAPPSSLGRRTALALLGAGLLAAPALLLRAFCVGESCRTQTTPQVRAPFCSLDEDLRGLLTDGYRHGRSPDVLAVTGEATVTGATGLEDASASWPSVDEADGGRVPLVFGGAGVRTDAEVPAGTPLADVAPTAAALLGVEIPHPEVRSGAAIAGLQVDGHARLLVLIAWKGVGSADLEARPDAWPHLRSLLAEGAGTLDARVGSLPLDPTAVLTTIGTGGLPREHGVTGSTVRNDEGRVVPAWGRGAPFSVIAALGDDLDDVLAQRPRVGLVATNPLDRGTIGKDWHLRTDEDDVVLERRADRQAEAALELLAAGYGSDAVPDLLAVTMDDGLRAMDRALGSILAALPRSAVAAVTATGSIASAGDVDHLAIRSGVDRETADGLVEATAVGGLFLDQEVLVSADTGQEEAIRALRRFRHEGGPLFEDVFGGRSVEFGEYC